MTKPAAMDLALASIPVNAIHPGMVVTPVMDPGSELFHMLAELTPLGRAVAQAEEMAAMVLFLAGDAARFITGNDLAALGGFSELGTCKAVWQRLNAGREIGNAG